jgi:hypothetical protein
MKLGSFNYSSALAMHSRERKLRIQGIEMEGRILKEMSWQQRESNCDWTYSYTDDSIRFIEDTSF